jgi:hypothetical protein
MTAYFCLARLPRVGRVRPAADGRAGLIVGPTRFHSRNEKMLTILHLPVLFVAVLGDSRSQLRFQTADQANSCFDHAECQENKFCAWSNCIDFEGRNISCGTCKSCSFCHCDTDSIDSSCPRIRCPNQPSQGVRFLQGVFLGHGRLKNASSYICTRRLTISGAAIAFLQVPIRDGRPDSQTILKISSAAASECPNLALFGVIVKSTATVGADSAVRLHVAVTSDGALTLRRLRRVRPLLTLHLITNSCRVPWQPFIPLSGLGAVGCMIKCNLSAHNSRCSLDGPLVFCLEQIWCNSRKGLAYIFECFPELPLLVLVSRT